MSTPRTVDEKVGDWWIAYQAIRDTLTPDPFRELATLASGDTAGINIGMMAARVVFANDRAAATVAALITQTGIKPTAIDYWDD